MGEAGGLHNILHALHVEFEIHWYGVVLAKPFSHLTIKRLTIDRPDYGLHEIVGEYDRLISHLELVEKDQHQWKAQLEQHKQVVGLFLREHLLHLTIVQLRNEIDLDRHKILLIEEQIWVELEELPTELDVESF